MAMSAGGAVSSITLGNNVVQTYSYNSPMARLSQLQVTLGGSSLFNRSYGYDAVGNVQHIMNNVSGENQIFGYDSLDRLTSWSATNTNQLYSYDPIGNLTAKNGTAYAYGSNGNGTGAGPHQARTVGGQGYSYDANGNLTGDGPRGYTWNAENQLTAVTGTASESYTYDGDGARASRTVNGITATYLGPLLDVDNDSAGTKRWLYMFGGQAIAQRTTTSNPVSNTLIYLHGDHLGSVSMTTSNAGSYVSGQEFDPWGAIRSGGISQTKLNYTGQRRDDTGLLYYVWCALL
jgi:YD repeat-containing protein